MIYLARGQRENYSLRIRPLKDANKRPEARQLLYSRLKTYMAGSLFNPTVDINIDQLKNLII